MVSAHILNLASLIKSLFKEILQLESKVIVYVLCQQEVS